MGIIQNVRSALGNVPRPDYLKSPFTDSGELSKLLWNDIFGTNAVPVSREMGMKVPSVSKARTLICGTIAKFPLRALDKDGTLPDEKQPLWMHRTDADLAPFMRMLFTLDDLLFYGDSLWSVDRGSEGGIVRANRVPRYRWKLDNGAIIVDDIPANADEVIYFVGHVEGLIQRASTTISAARNIDAAVETRAKSPIPVMEIHATGEGDLDPDEAKALVVAYNAARRDPDGATVYTPSSVELRAHGDKADSGFMTEGRNAIRLDVANFTGVPASILDGSVSEASLTYSTTEGKRNEFVDFGLSPYMSAIESRLSMDDVVPRGQRVRFDLSDFFTTTPAPTGITEQD